MTRRPFRSLAFVLGLPLAVALVAISLPPQAHAQQVQLPPPEARPEAPQLAPHMGWINTDEDLTIEKLRGHVVLLDFWTYCCINCIHVIPDLEDLEAKYADQPFVAIGVHSAKFDTEADPAGIANAVDKLDIKHPVVADDNSQIWRNFRVRAWPTFVLIDTEGRVVGVASGEGQKDILDDAIGQLLDEGRANGTLTDNPLKFDYHTAGELPAATGELALDFPGKVLAVAPTADQPGYLFVADSSHDRVIVASYPDAQGRSSVIDIYGDGQRGSSDGGPVALAAADSMADHLDAAPNAAAGDDDRAAAEPFNPRRHGSGHLIREVGSRQVASAHGSGHLIQETSHQPGRAADHAAEPAADATAGHAGGEAPQLARFHDPQGFAYDAASHDLWVADTNNHLIRKIDLDTRRVTTVAGTGQQSYDRQGGRPALQQPLGSPWALSLDHERGKLYIAMAGLHQLWQMDLGSGIVQVLAGSGREAIIDGPAAQAALAQPSGLALSGDHTTLYFADTEGSAIRALHLDDNTVETIIGRNVQPGGFDAGLFDFGDIDGTFPNARLQKAIGLALAPQTDGTERLLIADTYNDKIKHIDPAKKLLTSYAGVARDAVEPPEGAVRFLEPAGVSVATTPEGNTYFIADTNHSRLVMMDADTGDWREVTLVAE